jgi:hypothetical protein
MSAGRSAAALSDGAATVRPPSCRRTVTGDEPPRPAPEPAAARPRPPASPARLATAPRAGSVAAIPAHAVTTIVSENGRMRRRLRRPY